MATLYIVATPIGNLQDISLRALEALKSADAIFCEDTRVTAKLLAHFEISKPLHAYHQHSDERVVAQVVEALSNGQTLALVSDAGTPGINDPGGRLVQDVLERIPDAQIVPIPGANAAVVALSASGFPADRYQYWGFVPHKKGRQTFFSGLAQADDTIVFYESKHRILKTMQQLGEALEHAGTPGRPLMVARELTKKFETLYRGAVSEVAARLGGDNGLGEFVVVVAPKRWK
jgi:16S rRNA (cytidine1402-2'-O)-methyltransferase